MAHGKFNSLLIEQVDVNIQVYEASANCLYVDTSVIVANPDTGSAKVKVAVTSDVSPAPKDFIEHGAILTAGGVLSISGLKLSPGEKIFIQSNVTGLSVRVSGSEISKL